MSKYSDAPALAFFHDALSGSVWATTGRTALHQELLAEICQPRIEISDEDDLIVIALNVPWTLYVSLQASPG